MSSDLPGTPSLLRFKSEGDPAVAAGKDQEPRGGKDGPMGSKWKLFKALKERKAELKNQQAETPSSTAVSFGTRADAACKSGRRKRSAFKQVNQAIPIIKPKQLLPAKRSDPL